MEQVLSDSPATSARFRSAVEGGDVDGVLTTLSDGVVLRSPFTDRLTFKGHGDMRLLFPHVFASIGKIHYFADIGDSRDRALFYRAEVRGRPIEEATRLRLNPDGLIEEITLFFRPVPSLVTLMAVMAPRIARDRGRLRAMIARLLLSPLAFAARIGDRLVTKFI